MVRQLVSHLIDTYDPIHLGFGVLAQLAVICLLAACCVCQEQHLGNKERKLWHAGLVDWGDTERSERSSLGAAKLKRE